MFDIGFSLQLLEQLNQDFAGVVHHQQLQSQQRIYNHRNLDNDDEIDEEDEEDEDDNAPIDQQHKQLTTLNQSAYSYANDKQSTYYNNVNDTNNNHSNNNNNSISKGRTELLLGDQQSLRQEFR